MSKKSSDLRLAEINHLLSQLSDRAKPLTQKKVNEEILKQENFVLLFVYEEEPGDTGPLMGMGSIYFVKTLTGFKGYIGYIEDVVVDEMYRGLGLGERITRDLINIARKRGADWIDLTSNPNNIKRAAAIKLYKKLGFKLIAASVGKQGTNLYRLILK